MLSKFEGGTGLPPKNMIQLSMDGPNTNWKMYSNMCDQRKDDGLPALLNLGSCGLHTVHGAFKNGVQKTGWELQVLLKDLGKLFKDSPAK